MIEKLKKVHKKFNIVDEIKKIQEKILFEKIKKYERNREQNLIRLQFCNCNDYAYNIFEIVANAIRMNMQFRVLDLFWNLLLIIFAASSIEPSFEKICHLFRKKGDYMEIPA